jgi:2,3-bisphosphoglycerate-independent phosphoglycerate mutase
MRDPGTEKPEVESFESKWSMRPVMVADLPAELGIGKVLGMDIKEVAPGTSQEDYHRRAELVRKLVGEYGFVYVHLKGPDEPGHDGLFDLKKQRIEEIDSGFFSLLQNDSRIGKTRMCVTCDHSTPWKIKGHSDDPVPILITPDNTKSLSGNRFTEKNAMTGGLGRLAKGTMLLNRLSEMR